MEADENQRVKYDTGQVPGADVAATERRRANTLWAEPATYTEPDQETGAEYADVAVAVAAAGTTAGPGPAYEVPTGPDAEADEDAAGLPATRGFVRGGSVYAGFGSQQQGQQAAAAGGRDYESVLTQSLDATSGAGGLVQPRHDSVLTQASEAALRASVDAKGYVAGEGAAEGSGPVYVPA